MNGSSQFHTIERLFSDAFDMVAHRNRNSGCIVFKGASRNINDRLIVNHIWNSDFCWNFDTGMETDARVAFSFDNNEIVCSISRFIASFNVMSDESNVFRNDIGVDIYKGFAFITFNIPSIKEVRGSIFRRSCWIFTIIGNPTVFFDGIGIKGISVIVLKENGKGRKIFDNDR